MCTTDIIREINFVDVVPEDVQDKEHRRAAMEITNPAPVDTNRLG